jgi:hypothetical protein
MHDLAADETDHWWSRPIDEVLSVVIERYRTVC